MTKTITAPIMLELLRKIYIAENWTRAKGESPLKRAQTTYDLIIDHKANRYVATRKEV